jgi:hypothetical protein
VTKTAKKNHPLKEWLFKIFENAFLNLKSLPIAIGIKSQKAISMI